MNTKIIVEVCAGSLEDCVVAARSGAMRIELNNALHLGGLTPSLATLMEAKKCVDIPIVTMVRPRAGGFHYNDYEKTTMFQDARLLLKAHADGLAFGFLHSDGRIDADNTKYMVDMCHQYGVEAVFHRAFDQTPDPFEATETLIACGVDRILTSGLRESAALGIPLLKQLQDKYGDRIEFLAGAGVNQDNVLDIVNKTGLHQVHSSFKGWYSDPTTQGKEVSYAYSKAGDYDGVDEQKLVNFLSILDK